MGISLGDCNYRRHIGRHGDEAALYAGGRAGLLLEEGDIEGAAAWRAIVGAIEEVQRERGPDGRAVKNDP